MTDQSKRLGTVLRVKGHLEKKAQRELAAIAEEKDQETDRLQSLREKSMEALDETVRVLKARATELQANRAFLRSLSKKIEQQTKTVAAVESRETEKREELVERAQSRRMIEILQEKRENEEQKEKDRKEQRVIDILANRVRFGF